MFNTETKVELQLLKAMKAAPQSNGNTPQPQELNGRFYRIAPICAYCGQPCADDDLMTSVRDKDGNDLPVHKECALEVMRGTWDLLEEEGRGEPGHFQDGGHDDLLPDADLDQIRPYVVADLDKIMPAAPLDKRWPDAPQEVHTDGRR